MVKTLKISARLKIEAFDAQGRRIAKLSKPVNLLLGNTHKILALLFLKETETSILPAGAPYTSFVDSGGATRAAHRLRSKDNQSISYVDNENYADVAFNVLGIGNVMLGVGTDSTPPTMMDYALYAEVASGTSPTRMIELLSDGRFKITYAKAFTLTAAANICEAGIWIYIRGYVETAGAWGYRWVMLARDVFTAISVPAGGSVAVNYSFTV